ncbi:MAG: DNA-3-methyladenine glycosylase I [Bacteroidota bacterium]
MKAPIRCAWTHQMPAYYIQYHDEEWGVPIHDDQQHFELLTLEGAQAGLSWQTVLKKRHGYRQAWAHYDIAQIAAFDQSTREQLYRDERIVRNRLKIDATIRNAQHFLKIQAIWGSFDSYIWRFVDGKPLINHWKHIQEVPTSTPLSDQISQDLRKRGFRFVGSTIIYAYLQAAGLVNDHTTDCFRHQALS